MKVTNLFVYPDQLKAIQDTLIREGCYFIDSVNSIYCPIKGEKYIDLNACREWPNHDGVMELMTPGTAARVEVKRFYPDVNLRSRKADFKLLDISPPNFWGGVPYYGDLWHFDLRGAYAQIYAKLSLDVVYPRGQGEMFLRPIKDRLDVWKQARNSLVGITRSHTLVTFNKGKWSTVKYHNPIFNPHLWYTIQEILHEIASRALSQQAIYIATDGYFFRHERNARHFEEFMCTLGLDYHKFCGEGEVTGWGSYSIPGKKTNRRAITTSPLHNVIRGKKGTLAWWLKL